jgi:hypothetical protein
MLKYHLRTALVVTSADQAFYFSNGLVSSLEPRSRTQLGYMVGDLKGKTTTTVNSHRATTFSAAVPIRSTREATSRIAACGREPGRSTTSS